MHAPVRNAVDQVLEIDPDKPVWYREYSYYEEKGKYLKHGLFIQRTRFRDQERYATDYQEIRRMYYYGTPSTHFVLSVWKDGVLRRREYHLSRKLVFHLEYNEQGEVVRGLKHQARAGRTKRERIAKIFDNVYDLNTTRGGGHHDT